ncbi:MAG: hypothetical protein HY644_15180 [Acidobacteria bacterium]|nr:hypothetical protein [Acidobacteriota bacterium]
MADKKRLLELALKGLESERARINQEIAEIARELAGDGSIRPKTTKRRRMSPAQKKAHSLRMKAYWAAKKKAQKLTAS